MKRLCPFTINDLNKFSGFEIVSDIEMDRAMLSIKAIYTYLLMKWAGLPSAKKELSNNNDEIIQNIFTNHGLKQEGIARAFEISQDRGWDVYSMCIYNSYLAMYNVVHFYQAFKDNKLPFSDDYLEILGEIYDNFNDDISRYTTLSIAFIHAYERVFTISALLVDLYEHNQNTHVTAEIYTQKIKPFIRSWLLRMSAEARTPTAIQFMFATDNPEAAFSLSNDGQLSLSEKMDDPDFLTKELAKTRPDLYQWLCDMKEDRINHFFGCPAAGHVQKHYAQTPEERRNPALNQVLEMGFASFASGLAPR